MNNAHVRSSNGNLAFTVDKLPMEILTRILAYFPLKVLYNTALVSRSFHEASTRHLWATVSCGLNNCNHEALQRYGKFVKEVYFDEEDFPDGRNLDESTVLMVINSCPNIIHLDYNSLDITIDILQVIWTKLPNLKHIHFGSRLPEMGEMVENFAKLKNLVWIGGLTTKEFPVTRFVSLCPRLEGLQLRDEFNVATTNHATMNENKKEAWKRITHLETYNCENNESVIVLAPLATNLRSLTIEACKYSDKPLNEFAKHCFHLTSIKLIDLNDITDNALIIIVNNLHNILRQFRVKCCRNITPQGVTNVTSKCVNLVDLGIRLANCDGDILFSIPWACVNLVRLTLNNEARIFDRSSRALPQISKLSKLRSLDLSAFGAQSSFQFYVISHCKELEYLSLMTCTQVDDNAAKYIADFCPKLRIFALFRTSVTDQCINELKERIDGANNFDHRRFVIDSPLKVELEKAWKVTQASDEKIV